MQYRDYIVAVDENGQPYIAHAASSRDRREGAKWYQKIKTGYGWRYFYDPDEWNAYVNGKGDKPNSLIGKVKDKLGYDEKQRYENALKEANNAGRTYNKGEAGYDKAWATGNYAFGMPGVSVTVSKTDEEMAKDKAEADKRRDEYVNTPLGKAKSKIERMKESFAKDTKFSEYNENDPDFADENYTDDRRVGDSDFYMFKGANGKTVILEEDMKWTLPKGTNPDSPAIQAILKNSNEIPGDTWEEWSKNVTRLLDEAAKNDKSNGIAPVKRIEYSENDSDVADDNYNPNNRIGETGYFTYTNDKGQNMIIEEEGKWILPAGIDPKSPSLKWVMQRATEQMDEYRINNGGYNVPLDDKGNALFDKMTGTAINDAVKYESLMSTPRNSWSDADKIFYDYFYKEYMMPRSAFK